MPQTWSLLPLSGYRRVSESQRVSIKCLLVSSWLGGGRWQLIGCETQGIDADHDTFNTLPQTFLLPRSLCILFGKAWWIFWFFGPWAQRHLCSFLGLRTHCFGLVLWSLTLPWVICHGLSLGLSLCYWVEEPTKMTINSFSLEQVGVRERKKMKRKKTIAKAVCEKKLKRKVVDSLKQN